MRGIRSLGLVALYIGAQLVALLLAFPFKTAGLASTSNPNSPTDPLFLIAVIVIVPIFILWLASRGGGLAALRILILVGIGASLSITLQASLGLITPTPSWILPGAFGLYIDWSVPLAFSIAVLLFLALLMDPQWYVVDLAGFVAGGSLIALLGISFGILPCFILLGALAVYDAIAVYRTKHMISLADVVVEMKLPILMVMPGRADFDYTQAPSLEKHRAAAPEDREVLYMGLGDIVIPGTLVVSSFVWLPAMATPLGIGANLIVALGAMGGSLVGYALLMRLGARGY